MMKEKKIEFFFLKSYYGETLSGRMQERSTYHTNIVHLIFKIRFSKILSNEISLTGTGELKTDCVNCGCVNCVCVNCGCNVGRNVFFGTATCMYIGGEPPCRIPSTQQDGKTGKLLAAYPTRFLPGCLSGIRRIKISAVKYLAFSATNSPSLSTSKPI